ncbi:MAG: polymer-forming cytoskeletal protein [Myxococcota bacterium]
MAIVPRAGGIGGGGASASEGRASSLRGVVSTVAAMDGEAAERGRHSGIVDRVFGPERVTPEPSAAPPRAQPIAPLRASPAATPPSPGASDAVPIGGAEPFIDPQFSLGRIAKRPRSRVGAATKFDGELLADEDVEIQGLVEGRVCARRSRVTVGREGFVKSKIEARAVRISGTVRGSVTAEDWVEIKPGAFVRGDVHAPRVILHDGAIVTGLLDMAAGRERRRSARFDPLVVRPRPGMRKVRGGRAARGDDGR